MKIIVEADGKRTVDFDKIGKECISTINGKYIIQKYGMIDGIKVKEKLREERITFLKNKDDKSCRKNE